MKVVLLIFFYLFLSISAYADDIRYSNNIIERFSHKDWVSYMDSEGSCRAVTEFVIGGSIASLAVYKNELINGYSTESPYNYFVYGEYVKSFSLVVGDRKVDLFEFSDAIVSYMSTQNEILISAMMYDELGGERKNSRYKLFNSNISLAGASAAFRFCGFIE